MVKRWWFGSYAYYLDGTTNFKISPISPISEDLYSHIIIAMPFAAHIASSHSILYNLARYRQLIILPDPSNEVNANKQSCDVNSTREGVYIIMHCQQWQATSPATAIHHNRRHPLEPSQRALFNNTYTEIEMKLDNDSSSSTPAKQYPAVLPPTSHSAVLPYLNSHLLLKQLRAESTIHTHIYASLVRGGDCVYSFIFTAPSLSIGRCAEWMNTHCLDHHTTAPEATSVLAQRRQAGSNILGRGD